MVTRPYERYGVTGNPFRDLASETGGDPEVFHVSLAIDESLRILKEEALEKENRAVVALVGGLGTGKTQRLLVAASEGRARGAFTVYVDVTGKAAWSLGELAKGVLGASKLGGFRALTAPKWYRDVASMEKPKSSGFDPIRAGKALAAALNANAPAFLLLNDVHHVQAPGEADAFARVLQEVADAIKPGVLVMFGCYPSYYSWILKTRTAFASRINRTFELPGLSNEEAGLLLAKKLLAKRLVEDLEPLYPFDRSSVAVLNEAAGGNPRRLLELADRALEYGIEHRLYRVDADAARLAIERTRGAAPAPAAPSDAPAPAKSSTAASLPEPTRLAGGLSPLGK